LAHGDLTFCDVGKDFTANILNEYKKEVIEYLTEAITSIGLYLDEKKYKSVV